jgi:hypothetical protein
MRLLEIVGEPKGTLFWTLTILSGVIAAALYIINDIGNRSPINRALAEHARAQGIAKPLDIPERRKYNVEYLEAFIAAAAGQKIGQQTALQKYISPTLLWMDVAFAIALGLFTSLFAVGVAPYLPWQPWSSYLALFCAAMGICYGVVDVIEDIKLATIFENGNPVDPTAAKHANWLTRAKIYTIGLSIVGAITFYLFGLVSATIKNLTA